MMFHIRQSTKKIARNKKRLEGHIYKESCFMLDDYAENFLKPKTADSKYFTECEKLKAELADKNAELDFLQDDLSRKKTKTEKQRILKSGLPKKI